MFRKTSAKKFGRRSQVLYTGRLWLRILLNQNLCRFYKPSEIASVSDRSNRWDIVGTGKSSINTTLSIPHDSVVVGMNYGCLLDCRYDYYFVEFFNPKRLALAKHQAEAIRHYDVQSSALLIGKNFGDRNASVKFARELYKERIAFGLDCFIRTNRLSSDQSTALKMLEKSSHYFIKCTSTVVTAVCFAVAKGAETIVLHGVDLGGLHFFDIAPYVDAPYNPRYSTHWLYEKQKNEGFVHPAKLMGTGEILAELMPILKDEYNVHLKFAN